VEKLIVQGPAKLEGEITVSGAKNAALPIIFASILSSGEITLRNIPKLRDTSTAFKILGRLGTSILFTDSDSILLNSNPISNYTADYELVKTMRASILVLGPLLARYGRATVSLPGGCAIGSRPVDLHLHGLKQLGANITLHDGYIDAKVSGRLRGTTINMEKVSVGATENILMAAVLAEGQTIINGASSEPEVVDLANFLVAMGAKISGIGTATLVIDGVNELDGCDYTVMSDRIEAGTYMIAAAMTRGHVVLKQAPVNSLSFVIDNLRIAGAKIICMNDNIAIDMCGQKPQCVSVKTDIYPLFPTDLQAQWLALSAVSEGECTITESIFENRFMHVHELNRLGAIISLSGNTAHVVGKDELSSAQVMATDLRASASLVLAGLVAKGDTVIDRIYHIDRGYNYLEEKLCALGAKVVRG
jgi:UDP-N-acetylglucosamine 1-carboxyvinyltransferase